MTSFVRRGLCTIALALLAALCTPVPLAAAVRFEPPTDASVLDPFRLPDGPYGAGNRGIEYDTADGAIVTAAAAGEVAFSGAVAGSLFVSIDHPGGLRSTYGFVAHLLVRVGARVDAGDAVALAGGPFHFTVRLDGVYVDPAGLFGVRRQQVTLVPHRAFSGDDAISPRAAGLTPDAATLLDGPFGPRTEPPRPRRTLLVRATPGRFGVPHGVTTGKKEYPWQSSP